MIAAPGPALPPRPLGLQAATAAALGLGCGLCFLLPIIAYLALPAAPTGRNVAVLVSGLLVVLCIRRLGRGLGPVLDATSQRWRLPLLALYVLCATAPLAVAYRLLAAP